MAHMVGGPQALNHVKAMGLIPSQRQGSKALRNFFLKGKTL